MGFLLSGPGLAGIAIAFALAFGGIQTFRLKGCQADNARNVAQVAILSSSLAEQNRAVESMRQEGAKKQQEGAKALAKAEARAKTWDEQAQRLQAALTSRKPTDPQDCATAWQELRK